MAFTGKLGTSESYPSNVVPGNGAVTGPATGIGHRVSQEVVEYAEATAKTVRSSQEVVEYLEATAKTVRSSQEIVEYLENSAKIIRCTQHIVEYITRGRELAWTWLGNNDHGAFFE